MCMWMLGKQTVTAPVSNDVRKQGHNSTLPQFAGRSRCHWRKRFMDNNNINYLLGDKNSKNVNNIYLLRPLALLEWRMANMDEFEKLERTQMFNTREGWNRIKQEKVELKRKIGGGNARNKRQGKCSYLWENARIVECRCPRTKDCQKARAKLRITVVCWRVTK